MSPQRKSLTDDAAAFVFGGDDSPPPPKQEPTKAKTPRKASAAKKPAAKSVAKPTRAIDKLMQTTEQERQVRITVDLAASQHQGLTMASARLGKSKAEIIRALLDDFLNEVEQ